MATSALYGTAKYGVAAYGTLLDAITSDSTIKNVCNEPVYNAAYYNETWYNQSTCNLLSESEIHSTTSDITSDSVIASTNITSDSYITNPRLSSDSFIKQTYISQTDLSSLETDLVSYWKADSNGSFPDSLGTNDATSTASVYTASGKIGGAQVFSSTSTLVNFSTTLFGLGAKSVNFWLKPSSLAPAYQTVFLNDSIGIASTNGGFQVFVQGTRVSALIGNGGTTGNYLYAVGELLGLTVDEWHMITVVHETSPSPKLSVYINNTLNTSTTTTSGSEVIGNSTFQIGDRRQATYYPLLGTLDEFGYWDNALTTTDITNLYNGFAGLTYPFIVNGISSDSWIKTEEIAPSPINEKTVAYYKCDSNSSFPDEVGSNDGTITNATYTASGKINGAYSYNGSTATVSMNTPISETKGGISAWVKFTELPTTANGFEDYIFSSWNTGATRVYFSVNYDTYELYVALGGTFYYTGYIMDLNWHNLVWTWDSSNINVFVDGVNVYSNATTSSWSGTLAATGYIGSLTGSQGYINAIIDEVGFYSDPEAAIAATTYNYGDGASYPFTDITSESYIIGNPSKNLTSDSTVKTTSDKNISSDSHISKAGFEESLVSDSFIKQTYINTSAVNDDIYAYYKCDTDGSFPDAIGSNNGTINGATYTASGKVNGGYDFDGSDSIGLPNLNLQRKDNWTVSFWYKTTNDTGTNYAYLYDEDDGGGTFDSLFIAQNYGTPQFDLHIYNAGWAGGNVKSDTFTPDTNWHNVVVAKAGTAVKFYLDGADWGGGTLSFSQSNKNPTKAQIGRSRWGGSGNYTFPGTLDEIGFWTRGLTEAEVGVVNNENNGSQYPYYGITSDSSILGTGSSVNITSDSYIKASNSDNIVSSSFIKKITEKNISSDSYIFRPGEESSLVTDSYIEQTYTNNVLSDSYIATSHTGTIVSDSYVLQTYTGVLDSSSYIKVTDVSAVTSASYIIRTEENSITSSSMINATTSKNILSDSYVFKSGYESSIVMDSMIKHLAYVSNIASAAFVSASNTGLLESDAWILKTYNPVLESDSVLLTAYTQNITTDSSIKQTYTVNIGSDSYIDIGGVNNNIISDSHILKITDANLGSDLVVKTTYDQNILSELLIHRESEAGRLTSLLYIKTLDNTDNIGSDSWIRRIEDENIGSDSFILTTYDDNLSSVLYINVSGYESSIAQDSFILQTYEANIGSDSFIKVLEENNITSNSFVLSAVSNSQNSVSYIKTLGNSENSSSDSYILTGGVGEIESDSLLLVSYSTNITSDSVILGDITSDILSVLMIKQTYQSNIGSDSVIITTEGTDILSNSYILNSTDVSLDSDSVIKSTYPKNIDSDSSIFVEGTGTDIGSDSNVLATYDGTIISDLVVKVTDDKNISGSLYILRPGEESSMSSILYIYTTYTDNIDSNSHISITEVKDLEGDSYILSAYNLNISSDSVVKTVYAENILSDSYIFGESAGDIISDSIIAASDENVINSNSMIKTLYEENIESDSQIIRITSQNLISDSWISLEGDSDLVSNSWIKTTTSKNIICQSYIFVEGDTPETPIIESVTLVYNVGQASVGPAVESPTSGSANAVETPDLNDGVVVETPSIGSGNVVEKPSMSGGSTN